MSSSNDAVYEIRGPGRYLDLVDGWADILDPLGDSATAVWPNYPVQLPKEDEVSTFSL